MKRIETGMHLLMVRTKNALDMEIHILNGRNNENVFNL